MPDNTTNLVLPVNQWVDLYAAAGVPVRTRLEVENIGTCDIFLAVQELQPEQDHDAYNILKRGGPKMTNDPFDNGAWAFCNTTNGLISISVNLNGFKQLISTEAIPESESTKSYGTDAFYRGKSVIDVSLLHEMFTFNIPEERWYEMVDDVEQVGFTNATSLNGKLALISTTLNTKNQLRSYRHPKYEANRGHLWSNSAFFPNPTALAERSMGLFTSEAGVGFRLRAGTLYAFKRNTVDNVTADEEIEITLPFGFDLSKGNLYDIQFQWRGVGPYFFYLNLQVVATLSTVGAISELTMFNPSLPVAFESINQGEAGQIEVGCVDVSTEGGINDGRTYGSISISNLTGSVAISGYNQPVLVVSNKRVFDGRLNTRDALALIANAYGNAKGLLRIWVTRDETAITLNDQTWQLFRDGHIEYLEYNNPPVATPITFDTSKATLVFGTRVNIDSSYTTSALFEDKTGIHQTPGDIFIFTMHKENGTQMTAGITYEFGETI